MEFNLYFVVHYQFMYDRTQFDFLNDLLIKTKKMKTSIKIIAIGVLLSCVSCGAKKSTQSNLEKDQQEMSAQATDEAQGETAMNEPSDSMDNGNNDRGTESADSAPMNDDTMGADTQANDTGATGTTSAPSSSNMNYLEMYSELEMTDDQIQEFETGLRNFYTQQNHTPSGEMMGTLSDERDRQLKDILSEEQYSAYETWKNSN